VEFDVEWHMIASEKENNLLVEKTGPYKKHFTRHIFCVNKLCAVTREAIVLRLDNVSKNTSKTPQKHLKNISKTSQKLSSATALSQSLKHLQIIMIKKLPSFL
jgi:hypothetical protein